jgi:hypothetical protein
VKLHVRKSAMGWTKSTADLGKMLTTATRGRCRSRVMEWQPCWHYRMRHGCEECFACAPSLEAGTFDLHRLIEYHLCPEFEWVVLRQVTRPARRAAFTTALRASCGRRQPSNASRQVRQAARYVRPRAHSGH